MARRSGKGLEVGIDLRKSQEAAVAGVQAGRELGERQAGRQWVEHGLGRTLASLESGIWLMSPLPPSVIF